MAYETCALNQSFTCVMKNALQNVYTLKQLTLQYNGKKTPESNEIG